MVQHPHSLLQDRIVKSSFSDKRRVGAACTEVQRYVIPDLARDAWQVRQIHDDDVANAKTVEPHNIDCNSIHHGVYKRLELLSSENGFLQIQVELNTRSAT